MSQNIYFRRFSGSGFGAGIITVGFGLAGTAGMPALIPTGGCGVLVVVSAPGLFTGLPTASRVACHPLLHGFGSAYLVLMLRTTVGWAVIPGIAVGTVLVWSWPAARKEGVAIRTDIRRLFGARILWFLSLRRKHCPFWPLSNKTVRSAEWFPTFI